MNRFHVHVHVTDLDRNIDFYTHLFGTPPSVIRPDYAKWLLDDPQLNFAISTGQSNENGIAHLGLQAAHAEDLDAICKRLQTADAVALAEAGTTCCYARSDKYWAVDPQGVRWETFHTFGDATTYHGEPDAEAPRESCCGPRLDASNGKACSDTGESATKASDGSACCG
ncbi:MAG: VOC family protein [Xanthomonadales bacterium]|nr:VOC family protein [Xanthomonadales bacterium]